MKTLIKNFDYFWVLFIVFPFMLGPFIGWVAGLVYEIPGPGYEPDVFNYKAFFIAWGIAIHISTMMIIWFTGLQGNITKSTALTAICISLVPLFNLLTMYALGVYFYIDSLPDESKLES